MESKIRQIITQLNVATSSNVEQEKHEELKAIYKQLLPYAEIEEELGIDLITIFKALENGFYGKRNLLGSPIQKIETDRYYSVHINSFKMIVMHSYDDDYGGDGWKLKDYGKTWALTKEELL